jgi:hypothetical protein
MLLDLKPGYRPDFPFPGNWLYAGHQRMGDAELFDLAEHSVIVIEAEGGLRDRRSAG